MADIRIDDGELVLVLTPVEKLEGVHGDIRVPLSAVREMDAVDRPFDLIHGLKLSGTGIPGITAVGTWVSSDGKTFAAVHHASCGIMVRQEGQSYQQLIIG